jgi:HSP20 family protein
VFDDEQTDEINTKDKTHKTMATLVRYNRAPFFNPFFGDFGYNRPAINSTATVPVNVKETETAFHLEMAVPGLKKEDVKVNVDNNKLTVSYKNEQKSEETTDKYTRQEFSFNSFERSFRLPKTVNADQITASYNNGILALELPKHEVKEPAAKEIVVA